MRLLNCGRFFYAKEIHNIVQTFLRVMKNIILLVLVAFILSCSKSDPEPESAKDNVLKGTKWQTPDLVSEIIYGGVCYRVFHFKDNTTFEEYVTRNGTVRDYKSEGTFTVSDKNIQLKSVDSDKKEAVSNFVLINSGTFERTPKGAAYHTYIKQ